MIEMTAAEMLDAVHKAMLPGPRGKETGAFTVSEACETLNMSRGVVIKKLHTLIAEGKIVSTKKRMVDMSGRETSVPAYFIRS